MTKTELDRAVKDLFAGEHRDTRVNLRLWHQDHSAEIELNSDYGGLDITFEDLFKIHELFNTKNINVGSYYKSGGCETCDYGSTTSVTIYVRDIGAEID